MADIDTVLERLVTDAAFRAQLGSDPAAALAAYDLSTDDLELLAGSLDDGDNAQRGVEQRTSKSAVLGLLASLTGAGGGGGGGARNQIPAIDGAAKDTAYLDVSAPKDDPADSLGWIKLKNEPVATGNQDVIAPPDDEAHAGKMPGKPKPGEITLTRGMSTSPVGKDSAGLEADLAAPLDADPGKQSLAFKQGFPIKWEGADVAAADTDTPPLVSNDDANLGARKVEIGAMKAGDTSIVVDEASMQDVHVDELGKDARETTTGLDLEKSASSPPEDFLTIEDA